MTGKDDWLGWCSEVLFWWLADYTGERCVCKLGKIGVKVRYTNKALCPLFGLEGGISVIHVNNSLLHYIVCGSYIQYVAKSVELALSP